MITLNLLSPAKKEETKLKKTYLAIKNIIETFLVLTIIIAIVLLIARYSLEKNFNEVVTQAAMTKDTHRKLDQKIKDLNLKLGSVEKIQKEFIPWSKILIQFSQIVPEAIEINSLAMNGDRKTVAVKGKARFRENLLTFEENLKKSDIFTEIKSPITNILLKENIDFQFNTKLNLEKL